MPKNDRKAPASILDRITNEPQRPEFVKGLIYGPPGSGKTYFLGTAPNLLLLDVDGGSTTVRDRIGDNVTVWHIREWQDLDDAVYTLLFEDHGFETVALDSVSTLQEISDEEVGVLEAYTEGKDMRTYYGRSGAMIKHKIALLMRMRMHVFITAHMRFNDEKVDNYLSVPEEGRFPVVPDIYPSVQRVAFAMPDIIARASRRNLKDKTLYVMSFGSDDRALGKERNFGLPGEVAGLTIPKLINIVTGEE